MFVRRLIGTFNSFTRLLAAFGLSIAFAASGPAQCPAQWAGGPNAPTGTDGYVYNQLVLPNGDVIVVGNFTSFGAVSTSNIARYSPATNTFSALGAGTHGYVSSLGMLPGGDLIVAGAFNMAGGAPAHFIARYNLTTDTWSAPTLGAGSIINGLAVLPGGDVLIGGIFTAAGGITSRGIARYTPGTDTWSAVGTGVVGYVNTFAVLPGGDVIVGGSFSSANGVPANNIARYSPGTGNWSAMGAGTNNTVIALAVLPGGDVVVGGLFSAANGNPANYIARFNPAANSWSTLGAGVTGGPSTGVDAIAVLADGDLVVGGSFTTAGSVAAANLAQYSPTTGVWTAPVSGTDGIIDDFAVLPGGDVLVGGAFTMAGGAAANFFARYTPGVSLPIITTQPQVVNQICASAAASFSLSATSPRPVNYEWQWQPAGSGAFVDVIPGSNVSSLGGRFTAPMSVNTADLAVTVQDLAAGGYPFQCIVSDAGGCGGTTSNSVTLVVNPCPQPGTCCDAATGACTFVLQSSCTGTMWTQGGACTPTNPCALPGTCCNPTTGACAFELQSACTSGNWTQGGSCTPTNLCAQPGTCCNPTTGACVFGLQSACAGGNWTQGGSCAPTNPCPMPPQITLQPQSVAVCAGTPTTFKVRAPGQLANTFHWRKNGVRIPGATKNNFTIASPAVSDAGSYDCVITNSMGKTVSAAAVLSVNSGAPVLTVQPQPVSVCAGMPATFRVRAPGPGNKTFQWRKNGVDISGATANVLTINSAGLQDSGRYACVVSNACGTVRSSRVALTVTDCTHGSCCASGLCTTTSQSACSATWTANAVCSQNPCTTPSPLALHLSAPACAGQWMTLGASGGPDGRVYAATAWKRAPGAVSSDLLVVAGNFTHVGGTLAANVAAWDGAAWSILGSGLNGPVYALGEFDGELIAAGDFTTAGDVSCSSVAAWDGTAWHALGTGINGAVAALTEFNGDLIAGGTFSIAGSVAAANVARWDGESWQPLGSGTNGPVSAMCVYNGAPVVGGSFSSPGRAIVAWDGVSWQSLAGGVDGSVSALTVFSGRLMTAGTFTLAGATAAGSIAAWDGSAWSAVDAGMDGPVQAMTVYHGDLIAAGTFSSAGGIPAASIARWDSTAWHPLAGGANGPVSTLAPFNGAMVTGGGLSAAGGIAAPHLASWFSSTPTFASQPGTQTVLLGGSATFSAGPVSSNAAQSARWYRNGVPLTDSDPRITGSATGTLNITGVRSEDLGSYVLMVSGDCGTISSNPAELTLCIADFDTSGAVTVHDLYAFTQAWFARSAAADVNDDGAVTVQDLFDFLSSWFGGCN